MKKDQILALFKETGALLEGDLVRAPAVMEETFNTIAVYPGWQAVVDDAGDYRLERAT